MAAESGIPAARRRKLFVLADHIGLDRDDRMEFAKAMLWRDITSWSNLNDDQVGRLLDGLEGWVLIEHLRITKASVPEQGDGGVMAQRSR